MKKTSFVILGLSVMATACVAATPKKVASKVVKATVPVAAKANFDFIPPVAAEINGKKLTKDQLVAKLLAPMGGKIPQGITQEALKNAAKAMAAQYIKSMAILDVAIKAGFKPSPEAAAAGFNNFLKKAPKFQVEQIKKGLAQQGDTIETFIAKNKVKKEFQDQMAINAFFEDKILKGCTVSDKEVKAYYDKNPQSFKSGDPKGSMRASHILITAKVKTDAKSKAAARAKAEKLLALLKKDASLFEELAQKESKCPSGEANKGSLGAFQKGQMVPEFEQAVINLKDGEISAIVETQFGYHIIRRNALKKPGIKTFAEVKEKLKPFLKQQKVQKELKVFIDKTTAAANGENYII